MMPDNCAGRRRNHRFEMRLTADEEVALEKMAQENGQDVSGLVRNVLFKYNPLTAAKEEIQNAINGARETIRKGYSRARERVQQLYDNMGEYVPMEPEYSVGYQ